MKYDLSFTEKWYGGRIPRTINDFIKWGINSTQIVHTICGLDVIQLSTQSSPHTIYNEKESRYNVFFPLSMFSLKFYDLFDIVDEDKLLAAVSIYNGFSVHEGLHVSIFNQQGKKPIDYLISDYLSDKYKGEHKFIHHNLFMGCLNLIEDLYVSIYGEQNYPHLMPFLEMLEDITTNETLLDDLHTSVLSKLYVWRNTKSRGNPAFGDLVKYVEILEKVVYENSLGKRFDIAYSLYELLEKNDDFQPNDQKLQNSFYVVAENKKALQSELDLDLYKLDKKIEKIAAESGAKNLIVSDEVGNDFELEKINTVYQYVDDVGKYHHASSLSVKFETTDKWETLTRNLLIQDLEQLKYNLPKKTGVELLPDELYRLGTDSKVFGQRSAFKRKRIKPQVMLLIDHSGSMGDLSETVVKETYNLASTLLKLRFQVLIYAHTTDGTDCLVIGVFDSQKPLGKFSLKDALSSLLLIKKRNNDDGLAIRYANTRFLNNNQPKILVVLSDGLPQGIDYEGERACSHTQQEIVKARLSGTKVFSVSLVEGVERANDVIYGESYNISGENVESQLHKLARILN